MSNHGAPVDADTADLRRQRALTPTVSKPSEFRCETCDARCTEGTDGTELGHAYGCPERPAELPASYGERRWHGGDA